MRFFLLFLLFPLSSFSAIKDYPVTQGKFDYNYSEYSPDTGYWSAPFFTSTDISNSQALNCYKGTYQFPAATFSAISYIGLPERKGGRYISLKYTNVTCIVDWVEDKDTYSSSDKINSVVVQYNYTAFYCPNEKVYSENSLNKTYGCPTIEGGSLENYCKSQPVLKNYSFSPARKDSSGNYVANYEGCKYESTSIGVIVGDRIAADWRPVGVADPNYGDSTGTPNDDNNGGNEGGSEGGNEGGGNEGGNGNNGGNEGGSGNGEYSQVLDKINKNTNNISDSTNRIDKTLSNVDDYLKVENKPDADWREIFDRHFRLSSTELTLNENQARDAHDYTLYADIIDSVSTHRDPYGISDIPNWKNQVLALDSHLPEGNKLIDITQSIDRYSNGGATIDYGTDFKSYSNVTSLFGMDSLSNSLSQLIPHYKECSPVYIFQGLPYEVVIDCGVINKIKSLLYYVFMFFTLWFVFVSLINALKPQPKES